MKSIAIELPYPRTTGNHAVRHTRAGGHYKTPEARGYELDVLAALRGRIAPEGPISLDWLIAPPDRRARDFDNLAKVVKRRSQPAELLLGLACARLLRRAERQIGNAAGTVVGGAP